MATSTLPPGPRLHFLLGACLTRGATSGGPRQCIGKAFAMMEAVLLLSTIVQRFRLALVPGQRVVPMPSVTIRPEPGPRMVVARR
jgi:cytochrome P450